MEGRVLEARMEVLWVKCRTQREGEDMIQWKDVELFKAGVAIQESGASGDVRAYASNLVFPYLCGCTLVPSERWGKFSTFGILHNVIRPWSEVLKTECKWEFIL